MPNKRAKPSVPSAPTERPPTAEQIQPAGTSAPKPISDEQIATLVEETITATGPTLLPPGVEGEAAVEAVGANWQTNKMVDALWCINETRNAWMHVAGIGWRKLYNGRDGSFATLATLASQARQTGRPISYREEQDSMVYEIYLW